MDISFHTNRTSVQNPATIPPPAAPAGAAGAAGAERPGLVVNDARTDAIEAVPDAALRRDDALGQLFAAAFNLPAPPMPAFPAS